MRTPLQRLPMLALLGALLATSLILLTGHTAVPFAPAGQAVEADQADGTYWDERQEALEFAPAAFNVLDEQPSTNVYGRADYNELPE